MANILVELFEDEKTTMILDTTNAPGIVMNVLGRAFENADPYTTEITHDEDEALWNLPQVQPPCFVDAKYTFYLEE
jgi:hypothetical protein